MKWYINVHGGIIIYLLENSPEKLRMSPSSTLFNSKEAEVIGTHYSKSIECPVIKTVYKGVEIIWQYNFYDWQIMIKSPRELKLFNLKLYKADGNYLYYQGIPEEYKFERYSKINNKEFAIDIYGNQLDVYAFATSLKIAIDKSRWSK